MSMNTQENLTQVTFHFVNGQTESFNVRQGRDGSMTLQDIQQEIVQCLGKPWCILHLPEQTTCINSANVLKVEVKPCLSELQGEGVFPDVRRVTALSRSAVR